MRTINRRLGMSATAGILSVAALLASCAGVDNGEDPPSASSPEHGEHGGMDHPADGGPMPEGMTMTNHKWVVESEVRQAP